MVEQDRKRFVQLITDVLAFYRQDVSDFAVSVWWEACKPFDFEQVSKALTAHALDPERGQFAPKPADIVRVLAGTPTDRALMAWGKVYGAIGSVGAYRDVVFDDPIIHAVVEELGGWPAVCRTKTAELGWLQHRFTEAYRAYARLPEVRDYPRVLAGDRSSNDVYAMRSLPPPKPEVVGDVERARGVYRLGRAGSRAAAPVSLLAAAVARIPVANAGAELEAIAA